MCSHVRLQSFPHWLQAGLCEWEESKEMGAEAGKSPAHLHSFLSCLPTTMRARQGLAWEWMRDTWKKVKGILDPPKGPRSWPSTHECSQPRSAGPPSWSIDSSEIRNYCCQRHGIWGVVCYTALINTLGLESKSQEALDYRDQKIPLNCKEQELGIREEQSRERQKGGGEGQVKR